MSQTSFPTRPESIPIAIVGMACKLPGADNLEEYWRLLIEGRSAVVELPADRLDEELYYDPKVGELGKCYSKLGAIISSREFQHHNCPIPVELLRGVDPTHLLMCEVAGAALKHAGFDPFALPEAVRNCGVFIGHAQGSELAGDYTYATCIEEAAEILRDSDEFRKLTPADQQGVVQELIDDVRSRKPRRTLDTPDVSACMVAGTITKAFGLNGPFAAINSACASSLQSILLGARALQLGRVDMAIVGGASDCKSDSLILFSAARAMSSTGTRPFDSDADGLICGEGYAAIVLKTLSRALADSDEIHAVIRGLGISSDGKGKSLWAPRKEGQMEAMKRAYRVGADISKLQYLEAHSTATQLGDATELNTITEILSQHFPPGKKIPITSVKANIGHSLETAGIASVVKAVLCMKHEVIPPAINIRHLNPKIDWETAPIYVPTKAVPWPATNDGSPRLAGINAFGIGGLNMHIALEEFTEASQNLATPAAPPSTEEDAVAVIGMGCILPGAANVGQLWELLTSGRDPKSPAPKDRLRFDLLPRVNGAAPKTPPLGGFVQGFEYDWRRHKVPPKQIAQADPLQFMLLDAADQALNDAGYDQKPFDRGRVGVLVGTEFGGDFSFQLQMGLRLPDMQKVIRRSLSKRNLSPGQVQLVAEQFSTALLERWPALIDETGSFSTSSLASRIGKTWNLMGGAAALDAGEASSLMAVGISIDMLLAGDCEMMICAAGQRRMGLPEYESLALSGLLNNGAAIHSSLDTRGKGFIPGEGVGVLILKRLVDARRDGDRIRAIIRGVGAAHHDSLQHALKTALERSFQQSDVSPDNILVIELDALTHDMANQQLQAFSAMQNGSHHRAPLAVGSVSSQIGFTHGASGMASLLKAVLELGHGQVLPTRGVEFPARISTTNFDLPGRIDGSRPVESEATMASVVSCGRGMAYHLVCEAGQIIAATPRKSETSQGASNIAVDSPVALVSTTTSVASVPELEAFLINFVVEQTGYPAEVVELDADMEADLGIDSIKKAQLFGELQEYFDVTPDENLTLDDFPTLRHVVKFLARSTTGASSSAHTPTAIEEASPVSQHSVASAPTALAVPEPASSEWRIVRFGALTMDDLYQQLSAALADCGKTFAASLSTFSPQHNARLAIVADNAETLRAKLQLAGTQLKNPTALAALERQGVFCCPSLEVTRPRIAFMFPGQGSQYVGMLRGLVESHAVAAAALSEVESVLTQLGSPSFAQMAWGTTGQLGKDAWATQASMMAANYIVNSALRAEGIVPEIAVGHSYGEYCALVATGAWSLGQALRVTRARCTGIDLCKNAHGGLLAVSATPAQVRELVGSDLEIHVAIHNAPTQTVVGGGLASLETLAKRLEQAGYQARKLPVPCPFHTPLMSESCGHLRESLRAAEITRPTIATFSLVTNREIESAEEIRANLEAHMTRPQLYADAVRTLAEERPTVFVEVGPQQHLTRLNEQTLVGIQARLIASDAPKGVAREQVCRVRAMLECCGALDQPIPAALTAKSVAKHEVVHFDATQRRTEKMRLAASVEPKPATGSFDQRDRSEMLSHALLWQPTSENGNGSVAAPIEPASEVSNIWHVGENFAAETELAPQVTAAAVQLLDEPVSTTRHSNVPAANVDSSELEAFLVNFVVAQTGYPPELVELDADLEADLGIDSIKKAQLFGELQEYFDVTPNENLTLDDFPTLRHVVHYLTENMVTTPITVAAEIATAPVVVAPPAPDATVATETVQVTVAVPSTDRSELEAFLINFVVEQTGYPPELVELDADLEADLGIDSIKKAQLFGELQEYFDVTPSENLTLDDFPTLRHVVAYLSSNLSPAPVTEVVSLAPSAPPVLEPTPQPVKVAAPVVEMPSRSRLTATISSEYIRSVRLDGSAYEMGLKHGQEFKAEIRRALYRLADLSQDDAAEVPAWAVPSEQMFSADDLAELEGIADAVQVSVANLVALNLALFADLGRSSLQFAVEVERNGRAVRHALRDELPMGSKLADCLVPIVQMREPNRGLASVAVTYAGCVGALAGLNTRGLAVTSGVLVDGVARNSHGQRHTLLTRQLLEQADDIAMALATLQHASPSNPWNMVLSATDRLPVCVECVGESLEVLEDKLVLAANHRMLSPVTTNGSHASADRCKKLRQFLVGSSHSAADLQIALSSYDIQADRQLCVLIDHASGELAVYFGAAKETNDKCFCRFDIHEMLDPSAIAPATQNHAPVEPRPREFIAKPYDLNDEQGVAERFVLRLVDVSWPLNSPATPTFNGPALVIGDNPAAEALADQLRSLGAVVHRLASLDSRQAAIDRLEQLCAERPVTHLFLMSPRNAGSADYFDLDTWQRAYESQVLTPFFLCQRWVQLAGAGKWLDKCTVIAIANCNGDFGFSGNVPQPTTGALTGLMKSLYLEMKHMGGNQSFLAKAIDCPPDEPPTELARFICRELAARTPDYEVGYVGGKRYLQVAIPRAAQVRANPERPPRGNWIVTGGARGITAECALELGQRFGVKLHLVGTSNLEPINHAWRNLDETGLAALRSETILRSRESNEKPNEAWERVHKQIEIDRNLRAFAQAGVEVCYHRCDVADRTALSQVLEQIRHEHGPIEGILHGAGIERSCRLEKKRTEDVLATFGSKVLGAWNLMTLTRNDPIGHFIGFGSVSGRFGSYGQVDYCMASDMLCKLVSWYGNQRPSCHAIGFHWHPWDEIGMAFRPESRTALQNTNGLTLMPKREGLRHFLRELYAGQADSEVLVTDRTYHNLFYPKNVDVLAEKYRTGKLVEFPTRKPRQVASRHVLRMRPVPLSTQPANRPAITGPAYILGDNPDAMALGDHLIASGVSVRFLPVYDDSESTIAHLEAAWKLQPARNLFLLTARDQEAGEFQTAEALRRRMQRGVYLPFQVTQRWFQLLSELPFNEPATLVAVTSLGGDFGFGGCVSAPESGALSGLLKSVYVEDSRHQHTHFRVKVIDSPRDEPPADIAAAICAEVTSNTPEVEVAWSRGERRTVACVLAPVERLPLRDPQRGSTWVVTGGGRGITAFAALMLGRRFGLKLHVIGKSPAPDLAAPWLHCDDEELKKYKGAVVREAIAQGRSPEDDWGRIRKGREIAQIMAKYVEGGVEAHYHACDITDETALSEVLDSIRRADGPIEGVIHGAGYAKAARFDSVTDQRLRLTFGPKTEGTAALMQLTRNDPLRYFLAFGSMSGRYGGNGLSDYAAANEMLAKLCDWFRHQRPDCATTCFHWQTWDRIGMAMIADAVEITKSSFKMDFLQPEEGVEHLIQEVRAGAPESEVLIADSFFEKTFYTYPLMRAEELPAPAAQLGTARPLIDSLAESSTRSAVAQVTFAPTRDPFLVEHRLKQSPFLPGVLGLEAVLEAAALWRAGQSIAEVRDVEIINGLMFRTDEPIATQVRLTLRGDSVESQLVSELRNRAGQVIDPNRLHVRAIVHFGSALPLESSNAGTPPLGWHSFVYPDDGLLYHGPTLRCLKQFAFQYEGGWGQIVAPPLADLAGTRSDIGWILPAAMLDACVVCCGSFVFLQFGGQLEVPYGFEQIRWSRQPQPGEVCVARFYFRGRESRHSRFDFTLHGSDGEPLLQVVGYRTIRVGGENS
ncbi:MAG: C45 family autoproteolytic acyltransferase/hydrolase [Bythopirellula sp.]|nr:C45 family autoproteolytic acyltransferase/hydrolase [Bythopirellula sp.]